MDVLAKLKQVSFDLNLAIAEYEASVSKTPVGTQSGVPPSVPSNNSIMEKAVDIAVAECKKNLSWTGMSCEAEKYLAPLRKALGAPSGRFAWCGCFVSWCVRQAGGSLPDVLPGQAPLTIAYVPAWRDWAKAQGLWRSASDLKFNPKKGAIILYNWDGDAFPDHIGLVVSYDRNTDPFTVHTAEGNTSQANQSNGNSTALRSRNWKDIDGFIEFSGKV